MKNYDFMLIYKRNNEKVNIIKNAVTIFFLLLLFLVVLLYGLGKFQMFHVLTNSSAPFHPAGSLAVEYKVDFDKLKVGDFVTWSVTNGKSFVTHQVVSIDKENRTFVTSQQQYDDNGVKPMSEWDSNKFDSPKTEKQYYGKVLFSIPKLGLYIESVKNLIIYNGSLNILGTVTVVLVILAGYMFSKIVNKKTFILTGDKY